MQAVQDALNSVLEELPSLAYRDSLEEYVASVLTSLDQKTPPEIRKTQWEFVLRQEVFALAVCDYYFISLAVHSVLMLSVGY